jgi:hypothetical protein
VVSSAANWASGVGPPWTGQELKEGHQEGSVWSGPGTRVSGLFLGLREKARGGRAISRSHLPSRKIPSNFQELPAVAAVVNRSDLSENTPMWLQRTLPQDSLRAQHTLRHLPLLLSVSHLGPKCSACSPTHGPCTHSCPLIGLPSSSSPIDGAHHL